ncbi:tRNA lysidine(34) synthetase TilS [Bartonella sp. DGB1]|uniref:tRNA lysidine(34) synthetase TilS n=1 Tax=Bartonella sp. DGB1 TaxID=3239807 RepID=UPI003523D164
MIDSLDSSIKNFLTDKFTELQLSSISLSNNKFTVAVSGGGDSLALLFLLYNYFKKNNLLSNLYAVTIDHDLRAESADEAKFVAEFCKSYNIHHKIIKWQDTKPEHSLPMHARTARYTLLTEYMKVIGSKYLWVGHTWDDQKETIYMRQIRGQGRGEAGIPPISILFNKFFLLRPLLDVKRADLRHYLKTNKIVWVDDPTNEDLAYERPRVRKLLQNINPNINRVNLQSAVTRRINLNKETLSLLSSFNISWDSGKLLLPIALLGEAPYKKKVAFAVNLLVSIIGGNSYLLSWSDQEKLFNNLLKLSNGKSITIARSIIKKSKSELILSREKRHLKSQVILPNSQKIWDNRFLIRNKQNYQLLIEPASFFADGVKISSEYGVFEIPAGSFLKYKNLEVEYLLQPFYFMTNIYDIEIYKKLSDLLGKENKYTFNNFIIEQ